MTNPRAPEAQSGVPPKKCGECSTHLAQAMSYQKENERLRIEHQQELDRVRRESRAEAFKEAANRAHAAFIGSAELSPELCGMRNWLADMAKAAQSLPTKKGDGNGA